MAEQCAVEDLDGLSEETTLVQLRAQADGDFFVIQPIGWLRGGFSSAVDLRGAPLDGMTITVMETEAPNILMSVGTPSSHERWSHYDSVLEDVFGNALALLQDAASGAAPLDPNSFHESVVLMYYYIVNFGPLTHGSNMAALACLHALFLAADMPISSPLPTEAQLDWEALLCGSPFQYIQTLKGYARSICLFLFFIRNKTIVLLLLRCTD